MIRIRNTTSRGGYFDKGTVDAVWAKARAVAGIDHRKDSCGAWIGRASYGTTGEFGWEIDHIVPVALGGSDALSNLQPLHWENNRHKSDSYPSWTCAVVSRN